MNRAKAKEKAKIFQWLTKRALALFNHILSLIMDTEEVLAAYTSDDEVEGTQQEVTKKEFADAKKYASLSD